MIDGPGNGGASTDSDGEFAIADLPAGDYTIEFFSAPENRYLRQFYNGKETLAEADVVSLSAAETRTGIDAEMVEGGKIAGRVTAASDGAPLQGINACVYPGAGSGLSIDCEQTDADGEYTILGLEGGSYRVGFEPGPCFCDSGNYLPQFYDGKDTLAEADPVEVTLGDTTPDIDAQLVRAHRLTVSLAGPGLGSVTSTPAGLDCGVECSLLLPAGSVVALTAAPAAGSRFAGWSGACTGTGSCQVTLDGDLSVTSTFDLDGGGTDGGGVVPPPLPPPPELPQPREQPKPRKCKKGEKRKKVKGKVRCVKVKKQRRKHRQQRRQKGKKPPRS